VANGVQVINFIGTAAEVRLSHRLNCFDPTGTEQDACPLNLLKFSPQYHYLHHTAENQHVYANSFARHAQVDWMTRWA
jgi:hypothetical protein